MKKWIIYINIIYINEKNELFTLLLVKLFFI